QNQIAYVFYIDRFAGRLKDVPQHIAWLKALGVTYVHFMPCLKPRPGDSDGGYSVMDYRAINPELGTMADFVEVARLFRAEGMSVCIDLVLNHTAKEHEWAEKARAGDRHFQEYYWMFDSDETPKAYERTLIEIFPATAPGSFTHYPDIKKWVWTTFNEHQWDLNWSNPEVFLEITDIILSLANSGADVFRLDAVAFMWKRMGTTCQNLPEVHDILQALKACARIAAAGTIFKAEAIVAPRDLVPYLGSGRHTGRVSNLAYHNNLMVQFWSSLAAQDTQLMTHTLSAHFPERFRNASWATYIRCHDDIGWAITEEDAGAFPHMSGPGHRRFLADFYTGAFPGSFARGALFQEGLETALAAKDGSAIDLAVKRILLGHALIAAFGGIPLLYMGDEIGLLNDDSYRTDPAKAHDNRWMHRPAMDWRLAQRAEQGTDAPGWILAGVRHIMARRKALPELAATFPTRIVRLSNPALFAFVRPGDSRTLGCVFNFTPHRQSTGLDALANHSVSGREDLLAVKPADIRAGFLELAPYQAVWLG
ncbi:MAG: alpha-amylase family glycosyl hydrolase, partial [Rhizobiaceae bacterium]|nr:alpha-amylase family glycosyl hydrolase [Rhizobiaceae bacterium]